jgi:hypothetical protein
MLERREDGPLLQLARLALIVAVPGRCGGPRGLLARRRRRGPEGQRAAGGAQARNVSPEGPGMGRAGDAPRLGQRHLRATLIHEAMASQVRRAPRALERRKESCHHIGQHPLSAAACREFPLARWPMRGTGDHSGFGNTCLRVPADALHRVLIGIMSGDAILTAGAVAMSALVVLAGRLPADTQALGNVRPSDP